MHRMPPPPWILVLLCVTAPPPLSKISDLDYAPPCNYFKMKAPLCIYACQAGFLHLMVAAVCRNRCQDYQEWQIHLILWVSKSLIHYKESILENAHCIYIYLFISLTTSGHIHFNTQGKIAGADIEYCVLTLNVQPTTLITTHSFSVSSFTYLYLSRLVGEVPSGPSEPRREVFPHLLPAAGWSSMEFLGMLSSSARSVPVHGPPLFHSHPTQIHCCWTSYTFLQHILDSVEGVDDAEEFKMTEVGQLSVNV